MSWADRCNCLFFISNEHGFIGKNVYPPFPEWSIQIKVTYKVIEKNLIICEWRIFYCPNCQVKCNKLMDKLDCYGLGCLG